MPKFKCSIISITLMIFGVGFKRPRLILTYFHRLLRVCLIFADSWWFCATPLLTIKLLWLFFVLHTVRPSRSSGENKRFISVMKIAALKITGVFVVDAHPVSEMGCCTVIFVVQLRCLSILTHYLKGTSQTAMQPSLLWIQADLIAKWRWFQALAIGSC